MNRILFLFIIITIIACNDSFYTQTVALNDNDLPTECNGLIKYINLNWKKSKRFGYYQESTSKFVFTELHLEYLIRKNCLGQLNKEKIIALFGEPSKKEYRQLFYFLEKDCFSEEKRPYQCIYMVFEFDERGIVTGIDRSL